jgi:hypothetical protein
MKLFRRVTGWVSALLVGSALASAQTSGPWDQPAAALCDQIASIVGPGQVTLTLRNTSSIAELAIPGIRALLEKDLKGHGILIYSGETASAVRITLSQNGRQRLWIAEVTQGSAVRVTMVGAGPIETPVRAAADYMTLRRERLPIVLASHAGATSDIPVLSAIETESTMIVLRPDELDLFSFMEGAWTRSHPYDMGARRSSSRDPRGIIAHVAGARDYTVFTSGAECTVQPGPSSPGGADGLDPIVHCIASDEPWPILHEESPARPVTIKAFYNASRNFFTGVVTPGFGVDLPPFYSAALLQRPNGSALLIGGIDGKIQVTEGDQLKPVSGARDWGSDFALLKSGCGSGAQVIATSSGEAGTDSVRAYELPALEAVPASSPLSMSGTVTALWPADDGKSLLAAIRSANGGYEVDRVTALCN